MTRNTIHHFTCIAICSSPSRFTHKTSSVLYVTSAVFTVCGTRGVTVTAVKPSIITTWIKITKHDRVNKINNALLLRMQLSWVPGNYTTLTLD